MDPLIASILLSLAPISELRGGIPFAIAQGIAPWLAFSLCVIANITIIPFVFFFLSYLHSSLVKLAFYRKAFNRGLQKLRKRVQKIKRNYEVYGYLALTAFVAIPLPVTGAWTGSLIAWLLSLNKLKSFIAIAAGVVIAGIIVTLITLGLIKIF